MRVVFIRHGEPRKGEHDPELTSWGHRMALEAARWVGGCGAPVHRVHHTPTRRTRQTAQALSLVPIAAAVTEIPEIPETREDWEVFADDLCPRSDEGGLVVLVGHHPTLTMLLREYGPPPTPVSPRHYAAGLVLDRDKSPGGREPAVGSGWRIVAGHPGRAP